MSYEDVKVIFKVTLLNKMLFIVDLGVGNMFYTSTMLEFDHDHGIHFYFSSIISVMFVAKAKISKSVSD